MQVLLFMIAAILSATSALAQAEYETTRIADGVYQFRYQGHNGFFVVDCRWRRCDRPNLDDGSSTLRGGNQACGSWSALERHRI